MADRVESDATQARMARKRTHYETLGVPIGASIEHIKSSYRLLSKKTSITDAAYRVLTNPSEREQYDRQLRLETARQADNGSIESDYYVTFDEVRGWHVISDQDVGWELDRFEANRSIRLKAPSGRVLFGPFFSNYDLEEGPVGSGKEIAEALAEEKKRKYPNGPTG